MVANDSVKISIYPNPSNGQFNISLKSATKNAAIKEVIIKNKMGMPVYQEKFNNNKKIQSIYLPNPPTDIYTIQVFDGAAWRTEKLSLQR